MNKKETLIKILSNFEKKPKIATIQILKFLAKNNGLREELKWAKRDGSYYTLLTNFQKNSFIIQIGRDESLEYRFEIENISMSAQVSLKNNNDIETMALIAKLYVSFLN